MQNLSRQQKIILIVLAVLDVLVIGAMVVVILTSNTTIPADTISGVNTVQPTNTGLPATWTPTPKPTITPTLPPRLTNTPTTEPTPLPTKTPSPTPTRVPATPVALIGADFDFVLPNRIPGWQWDAYINYRPGDDHNPDTSYAEPVFTAADDPVRRINGGTLKIETMRWLKFRAFVYQQVTLTVGSNVYFEIKASAFSSLDRLIVNVGIDPAGGDNCLNARWGNELRINQDDGIVTLTSPRIIVPAPVLPEPTPTESEDDEVEDIALPTDGVITVCFMAEPTYPHVNNAAFFDQAKLVIIQ